MAKTVNTMENFVIFDNGGRSADRFTIIHNETGDVFGASENPSAPNGIGKFCGNCADHHTVMFGAGWRQRLPSKKIIKAEVTNYITNARLDPDWLGQEVEFASLPEALRDYICGLETHIRPEDYSKINVVYMAKSSDEPSSRPGVR
jgi:hypothetical protein